MTENERIEYIKLSAIPQKPLGFYTNDKDNHSAFKQMIKTLNSVSCKLTANTYVLNLPMC